MKNSTMLDVVARYYEARPLTIETSRKCQATRHRILERWHAENPHWAPPVTRGHGRDSYGNPMHETD